MRGFFINFRKVIIMKVLVLSWEYPPNVAGGLGKHVYSLTEALADENVEIHVITAGDPHMVVNGHEENLHVYRTTAFNPSPRDLITTVLQTNIEFIQKAEEVMDKIGGFDLIHAHDWLVAFAAKALKHAHQIPLVATIHATEYGRNNGLHNELQKYISDTEWFLAYEAWKVICCSKYMKGEIQHIFKTPEDKIAIIPNGVDISEFQAQKNSEEIKGAYAAMDEKVVFFVGRLVREKGVSTLLEAIPHVLSKNDKIKFIIAGKGPESQKLKARAEQLNITNRLYFTGFVDDYARNSIYSIADVAVVPSLYEPFGIVALEAMATHTPVIVSDTGGLSEFVHDGVGVKVRPGDPFDLASKLLALLNDGTWRKNLRENGYREVEQLYNWGRIARLTLDVYNEVLFDSKEKQWSHQEIPTAALDSMRDTHVETMNYYGMGH